MFERQRVVPVKSLPFPVFHEEFNHLSFGGGMNRFILIAACLCFGVQAFSQTATFYDIGPGNCLGVSPDGKVAVGTNGVTVFYWTEGTGQVALGEGEGWGVTNDTMVVGRFRDPQTLVNGVETLVAGYWKDGEWTSIGGLPGIDPFDSEFYSHAYGVSDDGSTIVGMGWQPNYRVEAFYWTEATGIVPLGQDGGFNSRVNSASYDGSIMVGWDGTLTGPDRRAYTWDPEPHFLGSFDAAYPVGECRGISPNGEYIVGSSSGQPFLWDEANGMQRLIDENQYPIGGEGIDVTDDGATVGGVRTTFTRSWAFYMEPGGEVTNLRDYLVDESGVEGLEKWSLHWGSGISADGLTIGGVGFKKSDVFSFQNAYVVRLVPPVSAIEITPSIDDIWLPVGASGDTIPVNLTLANLSSESVRTDFQIHLKLPGGIARIVKERRSATLGPNEVLVRVKDMKIAADGPPGTYEVVAMWGKYLENSSSFMFEKSATVGGISRRTGNEVLPILGQNTPNPFNPSTNISFSLPEQTHVTLDVFNVVGERVAQLVDEVRGAGDYSVNFDARDLASGMYFYRLQTAGFVSTKKLIVVK